jgi:hypothetical protein
MEPVAGLVLVVAMDTPNPPTLRTTVCRLSYINAVRGKVWAWDELTADPPSSAGTGALGAPKVHKVGLSLGNFPLAEACVDAVIVLVPLTGASLVNACGTARTHLQHFLNAILQNGTVHAGAVLLAQGYIQV